MSWLDDVQIVQQLDSVDKSNGNTELTALNSKLYDIYATLNDLDGVQTNALSRQTDVKDIMDYESWRLEDKAIQVDKAAENQKRIIYFNDNSRKIHAAYLRIIITAAFTLAIVWLIRVISHHFGSMIPVFFINVAMILTISIGLIIIYNYYREILAHNRYNYDELNFDAPNVTIAPQEDAAAGSNLLDESNVKKSCTGSYCCNPPTAGTPGTKWNPNTGKCEFAAALPTGSPTTPSATTPLPPLGRRESFTLPVVPTEYDNYSPYK
jgi:hypothetical protein